MKEEKRLSGPAVNHFTYFGQTYSDTNTLCLAALPCSVTQWSYARKYSPAARLRLFPSLSKLGYIGC